MKIQRFIFNPFEVNTYIIYDENTRECIIIDAACNNNQESTQLADFILRNKLTPKYLLNTHAHIDHILGNRFINIMYNLTPHFHKADLFLYESAGEIAKLYNIDYVKVMPPYNFIDEGDAIKFGNIVLQCIHVPGHSPGSICFYDKDNDVLFSGDVLFKESIGRTDLPGGNYKQLLDNISKKIFTLNENTIVYPGHGEHTDIAYEKAHNPFFT